MKILKGIGREMFKIVKYTFLYVVIVSFMFNVTLYKIQHEVLFPGEDKEYSEDDMILKGYEKVIIGDSVAWMQKVVSGEAPLVIFFPGNFMTSADAMKQYEKMSDKFEGYNFLTIDYPGYGESGGKINDKTMKKVALDVYDYVSEMDCVDEEKITSMGYSIGTGPAAYLASERDVDGVVLVAPYDNVDNLRKSNFSLFKYWPFSMLAKPYHMDIDKYAENIDEDVLIITSTADEIINYDLALSIGEKLSNKFIQVYEGLLHHDYFEDSSVIATIGEYISRER